MPKGLTYIFIFLIGCSLGKLEKLGIKALPSGQSCHQVIKYILQAIYILVDVDICYIYCNTIASKLDEPDEVIGHN